MGWLKCWNNAVEKEHEAAQDTQGYRPSRPEPLPDKPAATDFAQTGKHKQEHGLRDGGDVHLIKIAHVERSRQDFYRQAFGGNVNAVEPGKGLYAHYDRQ